tara:strand:+ start:6759 stop:6875 length:117 start_codon:yes stop_codon:yes gene_type:complete
LNLFDFFIICVLGGFVMGVPIGIHIGFNEKEAKKWGDE